MEFTAKLSEKGQIVIPVEIREVLGLTAGSYATLTVKKAKEVSA